MGPFKSGQPLTEAERAQDHAPLSPQQPLHQNYNVAATAASLRLDRAKQGDHDDNQPNVVPFLMEDDKRTLRLVQAQMRDISHLYKRQLDLFPLPQAAE